MNFLKLVWTAEALASDLNASDGMDLESGSGSGSKARETGTCDVEVWLRILVLTHYICLVAVVQ